MRIKITCPLCRNTYPVYHLEWAALQCQNCGSMVDLKYWQVSASDVKVALKRAQLDELNETLKDIARS